MRAALLLIALITAASSALALTVLPGYEAAHDGAALPWWFLVVTFAASESWVVHLYFRREAGSFSTIEIPLILGVLFAPPLLVWLAIAVGVGFALTVVRRQPLVKVLFNVANLSLHAAVVAVVLHEFVGDDALSPASWPTVLLAAIAGGALQMLNLALVITLAEGGVSRSRRLSMVATGLSVTGVNTALALVAALVIVSEPLGVLLLAAHAGTLLVAYRSYANERVRREQIEFLHSSTSSIQHGSQASGQISSLLAKACSMFRAERAVLYLFNTVADEHDPKARGKTGGSRLSGATAFRFVDDSTIVENADGAVDQLARLAEQPTPNRLVSRPAGDDQTDMLLADDVVEEAMVGVLTGTNRTIGVLIVADRIGQIVGFDDQDLSLFKVLTEQAATALENDHLERVLDQMRQLERKLAHQATHDALTGLANRAFFLDALERACTSGQPVGLLYIDLDDFKSANDRWGHSCGDAVLVEVAARLQDVVRPTDVVARLGGDEFAVLLASTPHESEAIAHRIVDTLSQPMAMPEGEMVIGASVGVALGDAAASDTTALLDAADLAMYSAKGRGKGRVATYDGSNDPDRRSTAG